MSVYGAVGTAESAGELAIAKALGVQVSFSHRGAAAVSVWCEVVSNEFGARDISEGRAIVETEELILRIPKQTGIGDADDSTRPVTAGDRFEYPLLSLRYFFVPDDAAVAAVSNGHIWLVRVRREKPLTAGHRS